MYYVSWNKYVNKPSPDLDLKPLKPFSLPAKYESPKKPHHQPPNKAPTPAAAPMASPPQANPTKPLTLPLTPASAEDPIFSPFPRLPTELRLKIWRHFHAQAPPQLLPFRLCPTDADHIPHKRKSCFANPHILALKQRSIPTILRICSESREVGLRYYKLGFDVVQEEEERPCSHQLSLRKRGKEEKERSIYWDPDKDIVHVELGWAAPEDTVYTWGGSETVYFRDVRYLALESGMVWVHATNTMRLDKLAGVFILDCESRSLERERRVVLWESRVERWHKIVCGEEDRGKGVKVRLVEDWNEVLGNSNSLLQ